MRLGLGRLPLRSLMANQIVADDLNPIDSNAKPNPLLNFGS